MAAFTDFAENKIIDWLFRGQALGFAGASLTAGTGPTSLYIGLLSTTPSDSSAGVEVSGNGYGRVTVASTLGNWAATSVPLSAAASGGNNGTTSNNNLITFPTPTGSWAAGLPITGVGIFDAATGGNLLMYSALTVSKTINSGDAVTFPASSLTFQLDN